MSVLIKGMTMPKNCGECPMICEDDLCHITKGGRTINERPPHCPLVEIPPHGRLVDADALQKDIQEHADLFVNCGNLDLVAMAQRDGMLCALQDVEYAPTIIESEEEDA